ncbi:MAG: hypothetical protein WC389_15320 [Lutibacter sp.]|jgi:hypothetical protein
MNTKIELNRWQPSVDIFKRLAHDAMTQYDADQYLAEKSIDSIKQCEFVGATLGLEFQRYLAEYLYQPCHIHLDEAQKHGLNYYEKRLDCQVCLKELKKSFGVK